MSTILESMSEKLAWEMTSWKSIHLRVSQDGLKSPAALNRVTDQSMTFEYIETAAGQRKLITTYISSNIPKRQIVNFFDGKEGSTILSKGGDIQNQRWVQYGLKSFGQEHKGEITDRPRPLFYYYAGMRPLHDALKSGTHVGSELVEGLEAEHFQIPNVRFTQSPGILNVFLHRDSGSPLKVTFGYTEDKLLWKWQAKSLKKVQGYHFPVKSIYSDMSHGGNPDDLLELSYTVTYINYNGDYPISGFRAVAQPGVKVHGKATSFPNKAKLKSTRSDSVSSVNAAGEADTLSSSKVPSIPVRAEPESPLLFQVSHVTLALGVCLLLGGLLLRVRRR